MEPWKGQGPSYLTVLFHTFYYYCDKENLSLCRRLRYIEVPLFFFFILVFFRSQTSPKPRPEGSPFFRRASPSGVHPFRGPLPILPSNKCHDPLGFHETFFPGNEENGDEKQTKREGKKEEGKSRGGNDSF